VEKGHKPKAQRPKKEGRKEKKKKRFSYQRKCLTALSKRKAENKNNDKR
jgi:hypothetical protein